MANELFNNNMIKVSKPIMISIEDCNQYLGREYEGEGQVYVRFCKLEYFTLALISFDEDCDFDCSPAIFKDTSFLPWMYVLERETIYKSMDEILDMTRNAKWLDNRIKNWNK